MANDSYFRFDGDQDGLKIYPLDYLNLNDQFNTYNPTYCKENKELRELTTS